MSLSSDEINFLVYRYLAESGFSHSAFTFAHESLVARSTVADAEVPPGALISFLAKGLQYVEIESHLQEDGSERACDEPFTLLSPHVCRLRGATGRAPALADGAEGGGAAAAPAADAAALGDVAVTTLQGHTGEAFALSWNQKSGVLASGAGDGTALLWRVPGCTEGAPPAAGGGCSGEPFATLRHAAGEGAKSRKDEGRDVSVLEWSPDGARLLSGCLDGRARLWSAAGALTHTLAQHTGQIYAASWAPSGALVATASGEWAAARGGRRKRRSGALQPRARARAPSPPLLPAPLPSLLPLTLFAPLPLPRPRQWIKPPSCGTPPRATRATPFASTARPCSTSRGRLTPCSPRAARTSSSTCAAWAAPRRCARWWATRTR
jgi:hypothetical protein